jgi:putative N6-adenine-specific DNA methylase
MKSYDLIATATFGLESIVADELKELGYRELKVEDGKVNFKGTAKDICKTNLWLRCADRVLLRVGQFEARSFEELFEQTKALPWSEIIPKDGRFPVAKATSIKSTLFSKSDCQAIVKKAVVESLKTSYKCDWFEETGADYEIKVAIHKDVVTLTIDTTGDGLHKRGYRAHGNEAPIKETLAAALVRLTKWKGGEQYLLDPTCGTGTILIEAAMIARNIAPGGNRHFAAEKWGVIPEDLWIEARDEAYSLEDWDKECHILGSDINPYTLDIARENIKLAGLEDCIFVQKLSVADVQSKHKNGIIISNPPYGERMSELKEVQDLYRVMGKVFRERFDTWNYFIITSNTDFEKLFGKRASKNRKLYNGNIQCYYYQYLPPLKQNVKK